MLSLAPTGILAQNRPEKLPSPQWSDPEVRGDCRTTSNFVNPAMVSLSQPTNLGPNLSITGRKLKVQPNLKVVLSTSSGANVEAVILDVKNVVDHEKSVMLSMQIPDSFLEDFAKSTFLKIRTEKKLIVNVPLADPLRAVSKLQICNQLRLDRDEERRRTKIEMTNRGPNSPPVVMAESLEELNALLYYPSRALQQEREGTVEISLKIGADGVVASCTVKQSTGHPDLDAASCTQQRRLRYWPAIGANGQPIEIDITRKVVYVIPK